MTPLFTPAKMNALVSEAYRRGLTVHIHAIGDLAVKDSLDAFEAARKANPDTKLPFVMTHVQFAEPEDIPRFGQLHVIAALQLIWAVADPSTNEQVKPYIDPEIYRWQYPARSILDTGGVIAGASDWPVNDGESIRRYFPGGDALRSAGRARRGAAHAAARDALRLYAQFGGGAGSVDPTSARSRRASAPT